MPVGRRLAAGRSTALPVSDLVVLLGDDDGGVAGPKVSAVRACRVGLVGDQGVGTGPFSSRSGPGC